MKVIVCKNYEEVSKTASKIFINLINEKPDAKIGFATGSTPIGIYKDLVDAYRRNDVSFQDVETYNLDEYCNLEKNDPQSYYTFMHNNLFDLVDLKEENIHMPSAFDGNFDEHCKAYNSLLNSVEIDLQLLGIGGNGHIGFNEPYTNFSNETFIVKLTDETRNDNARFFGSIEKVPTHAITMGISNILRAKKIILVASGSNKALAIYNLLYVNKDTKYPQTSLQDHKDVVVIVDECAASKLKREDIL